MIDVVFVCDIDKLGLNQESNGTMLLATKLLQANYSVKIYRFAQNKEYLKDKYKVDYKTFITTAVQDILALSPKCVSFYTLWPSYHAMIRLASEIKVLKPEIIIVFGGPQASATARKTMEAVECLDYISTGEGENIVVPFFDAVLRRNGCGIENIPGIYFRRNGHIFSNQEMLPLCDLDTLPYWEPILYKDDYTELQEDLESSKYYMPIDAGRGCPYNCTFCCTSNFWRRTYRLKSAERIVQDIMYYRENYGIRSFWFSHDAFTVNNQLVEKVCDLIIENKLDIIWRCTTRIDCITEELVLKMKRAGLIQIEMGIETGSERMQKLTNKCLALQSVQSKIKFLLRNGISVALFFMYGFPEETEDDLEKTLDLLFTLLDLGVKHTSISYCKFNPSTEITKKYGDQLVFDTSIKILHRSIIGFAEEEKMIADCKELFPFFYHFHTAVRDSYQYIRYLVFLYKQYPNAAKQLRELYHGNHLQFYRDFVNSNRLFFEESIAKVWKGVSEHSKEMMCNIIDCFSGSYVQPLKALVEFDYDYQILAKENDGAHIQKRYEFNFLEFKLKVPTEDYTNGWCELSMSKKNGIISIKLITIS